MYLPSHFTETRPAELQRLLSFLGEQGEQLAEGGGSTEALALPASPAPPADPYAAAALVDLCLAVFNSSEFVYLD